ncbi:MAG TPA: tetratricopeptide repeat protein, partial [Thermoanaerobaculia bacterium]|nr:tetratricopeptide repeat protein [Thermoanaerobaculia bacterium]
MVQSQHSSERGEQGMARSGKPVRSAILGFIRELLGVHQDDLAAGSGYTRSWLEVLERGRKGEPGAEVLERLTTTMGVSPATVGRLLAVSEEMLAPPPAEEWRGPVRFSAAQIRRTREFGEEMAWIARDVYRNWAERAWVEETVARDRETARELGVALRGREGLVALVREDPKHHLWALAEWLAEESIQTLGRSRERATECAEAALAIAELAPVEERFRQRLLGFCWGHLGNVRRASGRFTWADEAFDTCIDLWKRGAEGDPYGSLDAGRVLGLEASLRRDQRRYAEALHLLHEALPVASPKERPYLKLNHGFVLEQMGDPQAAIRVLKEAASDMPRHLRFYLQYNLVVNLCHLDRYEEAESLLEEVADLAQETGSSDNQVRLRWLFGRVASGLGRVAEAIGYLVEVKKEFLERGNAYDAALVSVELAKAYLDQGRMHAVKRLAREMAPVFVAEGIHEEAQKALELFRQAAERERLQVELVLQISKYLQRARRALELRFQVV